MLLFINGKRFGKTLKFFEVTAETLEKNKGITFRINKNVLDGFSKYCKDKNLDNIIINGEEIMWEDK